MTAWPEDRLRLLTSHAHVVAAYAKALKVAVEA